MKTKTTNKKIKEMYENIISVNYDKLQNLLNYKQPIFYNYGVNGWKYDCHQINNNTVIVTGYQPFGNIQADYKITKKYELLAEEILYNNNIKNKDEILNNLIDDFIKEILNK